MIISLVSICFLCTDGVARAGLDGQGSSVYPISCTVFMGGSLQVVLFGLIAIAMQMTGIGMLQIVILPVAVWILIWLFRLARDQIGVSSFVAICFVVGRFAVELAIGLLAGVQTGIGLGYLFST